MTTNMYLSLTIPDIFLHEFMYFYVMNILETVESIHDF